MNLDAAIDELIEFAKVVREASYADDKTPLQNSLALRKMASSDAMADGLFDTVIFGDLNEFKSLNDTHGHDAGDVAIEQAGALINECFVISEIGANGFRQSGDEFVILLKHDKITEFMKLVGKFASIDFVHQETEMSTKMSFGLAVSDEETDFPGLLKRAETACLAAKAQGNGKCVEWTNEIQIAAHVSKRKVCKICRAVNSCSVPPDKAGDELLCCSCCGERF